MAPIPAMVARALAEASAPITRPALSRVVSDMPSAGCSGW